MRTILDIGCGTGFRTSQLSKMKDTRVVGIDISEDNIHIAKQRYPTVTFQVMSSEDLQFGDNEFDCVYAVDVLEHVDNLQPVLKEVKRVLKKHGTFIIVVPAEKSEKWLLKLRPTYFTEIHHVRIFTNTSLQQVLQEQGFTLQKKKPKNFLQHIELYYFFKSKHQSASQLEIGKWDNDPISMALHAIVSSFDPYWVFHTPLKFIPTWLITIPLGYLINFFGNKQMPKSMYYEFTKD